jgi:hypothetical protein
VREREKLICYVLSNPLLFRYLCLDEADRMIDMGFEENVREIMSFFKVCPFFHSPFAFSFLPPLDEIISSI